MRQQHLTSFWLLALFAVWSGASPSAVSSAHFPSATSLPTDIAGNHSAADALEAQKPDVLAQNSMLMALAAFWIADRPERFASPWSAERTAKMLRAQNEYEELKAFNLWPFGDLGAGEKSKPE